MQHTKHKHKPFTTHLLWPQDGQNTLLTVARRELVTDDRVAIKAQLDAGTGRLACFRICAQQPDLINVRWLQLLVIGDFGATSYLGRISDTANRG
jgi:hypothetical protein